MFGVGADLFVEEGDATAQRQDRERYGSHSGSVSICAEENLDVRGGN